MESPELTPCAQVRFRGLSVATVVFQDGTDIYRDRQVVAERLATLESQLPGGHSSAAKITPLTSSTSTVLEVGANLR